MMYAIIFWINDHKGHIMDTDGEYGLVGAIITVIAVIIVISIFLI